MKEIFIERREELLRIAIKRDNKLIDCFMEEEEKCPYPGQIYKAVVKSIVPAIKSAFVDIGLERNAYLYLQGKYEKKNIKKGDELVVEIVKEELGNKGAKVTTAFSLPGRYLVILTDNNEISFSSKISSAKFKEEVIKNIRKPQEIGIKIRTNAIEVSIEDINKEIDYLYNIYVKILREKEYKMRPGVLYSDEGVIARVLRDSLDNYTEKITVDDMKDYKKVKEYITEKSDIDIELELYEGHRSLFDIRDIEKELLHLRNRRVNLHCGGYIVIDKTEAMFVIDVNSGRNISAHQREKTALVTNLEAAESAAEQIRLRNLSGIIVIDFIDMMEKENKKKVIEVLKKKFEEDKNKTLIYPFTELSLVQIARRRRGKTLLDFMEDECTECRGQGRKLKFSYICVLIKNEILRIDNESRIKNIYIEINESYKGNIEDNLRNFITTIEGENKSIYLKYTNEVEGFKMEALIFNNQVEAVDKYRIYG